MTRCVTFRLVPKIALYFAAALLFAGPVVARENIGMFETWGAFRDPAVPRCYAIAMAEPSALRRDYQPYATVGTWPAHNQRNQVHFRLSRRLAPAGRIVLVIGRERFPLTGGGGDAWAQDKRSNAAIIAAMRSAQSMTVHASDAAGNDFSNTWPLAGGATAMDAATIACARLR